MQVAASFLGASLSSLREKRRWPANSLQATVSPGTRDRAVAGAGSGSAHQGAAVAAAWRHCITPIWMEGPGYVGPWSSRQRRIALDHRDVIDRRIEFLGCDLRQRGPNVFAAPIRSAPAGTILPQTQGKVTRRAPSRNCS